MRAAIYARFSTDLQSAASIDDQVRVCRERIEQEGHQVFEVYADRAISGANRVPGIQSLMADATKGKFDLVYAEALDRISRDQEDVAGVYKRLRFADVRMITLAEGLARIDRRIRKIVDAIADGVPARSLKDELLGLEARQDQIKASLTASPEPKVYLAPSMADIYSQKVGELHQVLAAGSEQPEVYDPLRSLVDRVMLTPIDGALRIDLHGEIAEILKLSAGGKKQAAEVGQAAKQFVMVAGVGFEPTSPVAESDQLRAFRALRAEVPG
jgi:Resolvase, N terminal domain